MGKVKHTCCKTMGGDPFWKDSYTITGREGQAGCPDGSWWTGGEGAQ